MTHNIAILYWFVADFICVKYILCNPQAYGKIAPTTLMPVNRSVYIPAPQSHPQKQAAQAWLLLLCIGLAAHAFLLLSDGLAYDSWLMYFHRQAGRFDLVIKFYTEHRIPHIAFLRWMIGYAPNFAVANHWLEFAALLVSCGLLYHICRKWALGHRDSLLVAVFSLVYPAYQALPADEGLVYQWVLPVFFGGVYAALTAEKTHGVMRWLWRVVAWLCFLLSFNTGSLMVFYYGVLPLILFAPRPQVILQQSGAIGRNLIDYLIRPVIRNIDFVLLPIVFWVLNRYVLFSKAPIFNAEYNTPKLAYALNLSAWLRFINIDVIGVFSWALGLLPVGLVVLGVIIAAKYTAPKAESQESRAKNQELRIKSKKPAIWMLLYGTGLLICAMFPYVAVNKIASLHGNDTRFALLLCYPIGLILAGGLKLLLDARYLRMRTAGWALAIVLMLAFVLANIDNNLAWFARWIKMTSVSANMAGLPAAKTVSIIDIDDQFTPLTNEDTAWGLVENYFDWTGALQLGLGPRVISADQLVLVDLADKMSTPEDRAFMRQYYLVDQFDPKGCRAKLTITRSDTAAQMGQFGMTRRYLYYRYLAPAALPSFLRGLSTVSLGPCK